VGSGVPREELWVVGKWSNQPECASLFGRITWTFEPHKVKGMRDEQAIGRHILVFPRTWIPDSCGCAAPSTEGEFPVACEGMVEKCGKGYPIYPCSGHKTRQHVLDSRFHIPSLDVDFDYLVPECFIEVLVVHFRRSFSLTRLGNSNDLGIELLFFFHRISPSISELNCLVGVLSARKRRILAIEYSMRSATVAALCNCFPASSLCFLFKGFHCT
jgi:hypothetical protein